MSGSLLVARRCHRSALELSRAGAGAALRGLQRRPVRPTLAPALRAAAFASSLSDSAAAPSPSSALEGPPPSSSHRRPLKEILDDLVQPLPERLLRTRAAEDGSQLAYIPWHIANKVLSYYAPGWCGEVRSILYHEEAVTVVYRVTIRAADEQEVYREATGTAPLPRGGGAAAAGAFAGADPVQSAEGMAFRRACARLGLGLYLYQSELPKVES